MRSAIDASGMIAYLRAEPGGEKVRALLASPGGECFAHVLNLCEVYYDFMRVGGGVVTSDHHEFDAVAPLGIVPVRFIR